MKKTVRLMAAMAVLLTASGCSQDDLMPDGGKGKGTGAVGVTTFVANGARGVALNNTDDLIASENGFDLFAYESDETQFMGTETDGIEFAYNGGWDYVNAGEVKFWRQVTDGNTVNFYAVSPANTATPTIGYDAQTINYTVADNSADQKDLMYAKTLGVDPKNQTVIDNGVHLDFYHALSQIVFKARTTDEYITANVEEVEIVNLHNAGTFTFANAAYEDYTAEVTPWEITGAAPEAAYLAEIPDAKVTGIKAEATDLTTSATALLLLPQEVKGAVTPDKTQAPEDGGTYVRVKCHVTYKGENDDAATDIYGTDGEYANLYIPLNSVWKAGYKYIYTIVFSKDISDPVTINEDLYVGPWYDGGEADIAPNEGLPTGIGTAEDPYLIWTAEQLATVRDNINNNGSSVPTGGEKPWNNANYKLMKDIDLSVLEDYECWTPIKEFEGTFDGNGYTIKNLILKGFNSTAAADFYAGLFDTLRSGGSIKNLNVTELVATGNYVGGIVGVMGSSSIVENCSVSGTFTGTSYGGGIVYRNGNGVILNCTNYATATNIYRFGGIVDLNGGTIIGCVNEGAISGNGSIGGIASTVSGTIVGCYNIADLSGTKVGGIVADPGTNASPKVIASYNIGTLTGTTVGGIAGNSSIAVSDCYYTAIDGETGVAGSSDVQNQTTAIADNNWTDAALYMNNAIYEIYESKSEYENQKEYYNLKYVDNNGNAPLTLEKGAEYTDIH